VKKMQRKDWRVKRIQRKDWRVKRSKVRTGE
jgi:hypothetical protein